MLKPGHSARRWVLVLALSPVVAVALQLALPLAWPSFLSVPHPYSRFFLGIVAWVGIVVALYVAIDALRIKCSQWHTILTYPPLWFAAVCGGALAALSARLPLEYRPYSVSLDWHSNDRFLPFVVALVAAISFRWLLRLDPGTPPQVAPVRPEDTPSTRIRNWINAGERPIVSGASDLFQHQRVASRIANLVGKEGRPVALLGEFGTGKTSIINLARADMDGLTPTVIVADFDVWAVPQPEDIPRLALTKIIAALDDHIDTFALRHLPFRYQRLVAAEPTGRLERVLGLEPVADSLELLGRLTPLLDVMDARLVLIVQDVERLGPNADTRHLERFLWALRQEVNRATYILAFHAARSSLDYSKLCDTIELVPPVEARDVRRLLTDAYDQWTTAFSDIDPHLNRPTGGKLQLTSLSPDTMAEYITRAGGDTPLEAIVSLLRTPRALKHILRQVDIAWRKLHGEADLDDLIIVAALRYGEETAYKFLLGAIDAARHAPNEILPRTTTVKDEWAAVKNQLANPRAVQFLVDLLGVEQLTDSAIPVSALSPQGVRVRGPTDYFRRILAEDLDPDELRDQTVLRDIGLWRRTREGDLVQSLLATSDSDKRYADVWHHFAAVHSDAELMELTEAVVTGVLTRDGSAATGYHPAILALWVACGKTCQRARCSAWVQSLILRTVPMSLRLTNDLYYFWTGENGIVLPDARGPIRRAIVEAVRNSVRTGRDLTRVLTRKRPYSLMDLVTQSGDDTTVSAYEVWRDYLPRLLIEGAKQDPETVVPELANLAGGPGSYTVMGGAGRARMFRRYEINREGMARLFGEKLDEMLSLLAEYNGDDEYAVRAKEDATSWIAQRGAHKGRE